MCEVVETFENDRDALSEQLCLFLCRCCLGNKDRTCSNLSADQQLEAFPGQALPLLFLLCSMYEHTLGRVASARLPQRLACTVCESRSQPAAVLGD